MTKKPSFFKVLGEYFRTHPLAVIGWFWVVVTPIVGSIFLTTNYFWLEKVSLFQLLDKIGLTLGIAFILGFALLPTTLTALACGFFWGWIAFIPLILGYFLANGIGYGLGRKLNVDFLNLLYQKNPELEQEIQKRIHQPASLIFFVRISPIIPFALSNFIFASLRIRLGKVLLWGVPGMLPRTMMAFSVGMIANSFLGAKQAMNHPIQITGVLILFLISLAGLYWSWKKAKN